jgi:phage terminase small subunit
MDMKLTIKQEAFCQAYVRLGDKSAAYREAYNCSRLKDKSIHELACKLSTNVKVTARIEELQAKVSKIAEKKFNITATEMLRHLNILRQSRIDEYVEYYEFDVTKTETTGTGKNKVTSTTTERKTEIRFKTFDKLTPEQLMCIESIKQNRYGEIELKLHGKEWTIEKINKHIGFYEKDNEQKNSILSAEDKEKRIAELKAKLLK